MSENQTITDAIVIPLLKALVSAALVGLAVVSGYGLYLAFTGWRLFWFVASMVALAVWATASKGLQRETYVAEEKVYPMQTTRVEVIAKDPQSAYLAGRFIDLPLGMDLMAEVAREYNRTKSFSMAAMAGPGKPLSRNDYELLRDTFINRGLAYWVNPQAHAQGVALTQAGVAVMRRLLSTGSAHAHAGVRAPNMEENYG